MNFNASSVFLYLFLFLCMSVAHVAVHHLHALPLEARRGHPRTDRLWMVGLKPKDSEDQSALNC